MTFFNCFQPENIIKIIIRNIGFQPLIAVSPLKSTPESKADKIYPIDYKGIILYAKKQGKYPSELTDEEKRKFILQ